ncbi:hypothetical protein GLW04_13495 [Halobacillus litoralis]|uniref:YtxH domain-containing protein n=1 Tax=Halobacillus litoralis TaxID=45668 RepID=A0A845DX84_9BACI|nr:YtxH domain-containing protein [Halobacillus litoralis]MYL20912.1 hypothetical protein [Halobacillus litoralis]
MSDQKTTLTAADNSQKQNPGKSNGKVARAIIGGVVGAVTGLMLNPGKTEKIEDSSLKEKTRKAEAKVKDQAQKAEEKMKDFKDKTKDKAEEVVDGIKNRKTAEEEEVEKLEQTEEAPALEGPELSQDQIETSEKEAAASEAPPEPVDEDADQEEEMEKPPGTPKKTSLTINDDTVQ